MDPFHSPIGTMFNAWHMARNCLRRLWQLGVGGELGVEYKNQTH